MKMFFISISESYRIVEESDDEGGRRDSGGRMRWIGLLLVSDGRTVRIRRRVRERE
jgi:hypothetical protein